MSQKAKYLLTGVTGGLGAKILDDLLKKHNVPPSSIIVTSRSSSNRSRFESSGLEFRELDYYRPDTILAALQGVENLLFVSGSSFDINRRRVEHQNVVDGAKAAGVGRTWYISLAFGGFGINDKISFQLAHNETEEMMIKSGIDFISLRAGAYIDAFPLFLHWYPTSKSIDLPVLQPPVSAGQIAFTSRDELGEGMATLLVKGLDAFPSIKPKTERNIILLTANKTVTFLDVANTINKVRPQAIPIRYLEPEEWVAVSAADDEGGKSKAYFESRLVWFAEMCKGAAQETDPALGKLLGREPLDGIQAVTELLKANESYTWHQNYSGR